MIRRKPGDMAEHAVADEVGLRDEGFSDSGKKPHPLIKMTRKCDIFEKPINELSVHDVYDMAASIGKDFEGLTDMIGGSVFTDVMPKIVRVLEMLESFSMTSQSYSPNVVELQATVQQLKIHGVSTADKHSEDLETIKSAWRDETKQLQQSIDTLQNDNMMMANLLAETVEDSDKATNATEKQDVSLNVLNESIEKQKAELQEKARVIEQQVAECEALQSQADQLSKLNVNLRRKLALMEKRSITLASQCTDIQSTCKEKDRQIKELHKRISELNETLKTLSMACNPNETQPDCYKSPTLLPIPDPLLANKLIIDLEDPNRPRYTMHELQEVLSERNCFKLKTILLEDELNYYKQFFKEGRKDESWVELDDELVTIVPKEHEVNNNENIQQEQSSKPDGVIQKLFASIFSRNTRSPELPHVPERPSLPCVLKYNPPLIDESDVMPTIDIPPSPDEEEPHTSSSEKLTFGNLRFWSENS